MASYVLKRYIVSSKEFYDYIAGGFSNAELKKEVFEKMKARGGE